MKQQKKKIDTSGSPALTHNPFAALALSPPAEAPAAPRDVDETARAPETSEAPLRFSQKVVVRRETKGRGGKTVTRITGLPAAHREALAGRMKKALGCGAIVEGDDVLLLGSLVDRAADWLEVEGAARVVRAR